MELDKNIFPTMQNYNADEFMIVGSKLVKHRGRLTAEIPRGVTEIGDNAFNSCDNLTNVVIPESITNIEIFAVFWLRQFGQCEQLK